VQQRFQPSTSSTKRSLENAGMPLGLSLILWGIIGSAIYYFL
jgi:hypothetical protein